MAAAAALKDTLKEDILKDPIRDPINHQHSRRDILRRDRLEAGEWCHCKSRKLQTSPSKRD